MRTKQNQNKRETQIRYRFQKGDILAIVLVVVLAVMTAVAFIPKEDSSAAFAEIYRDGERLQTVPLAEDTVLKVTNRYTNTVTIQDGKVAITESDCPTGDCISCGWISGSARSIVCLPNGIEIRIVSESDDVDFVVG